MRLAPPRFLRRLAVAVLVAAAAPALPGPLLAPAAAAGGFCSAAGGVNVVVDFGSLGGGVLDGCGHGPRAIDAFVSAGFALGYNPQMGAGYVCTVSGRPADRHCVGTTSYWGLYVAPQGGSWRYAQLGAASQAVRGGDTVGLAWQSSGGQRKPGTAPAPVSATPTARPTHAATKTPPRATTSPTRTADAQSSASPTDAGAASASGPTTRASGKAHPERQAATASASSVPSASNSTSAAAPAPTSDRPADARDPAGLPWWVPVGIVALLVLGAVTLVRRRGLR